MSKVGAIILAAGQARRFGTGPDDTKLLAKLDGRPLIRHVAEAASGSKARPLIAVTGHAAEKVEAAIADLDLYFVRNPDPAAGLSQSLRIGLDQLPDDICGAVILLGDMPYVTAALIDRLIAEFETGAKTALAIVPVREGRRGNPVLLAKSLFAEIRKISGDRGARSLIETLPHGVVEVPIEDEAIAVDIDTPEMLATLATRSLRP